MQRFKTNDAVFILPKFAHLYPGHSAVVLSVSANRFRPMFNEYTVEFANAAPAKLFEFQIIEDAPNYKTLIADLIFDSQQRETAVQTRGHVSGRQLILQTAQFDLDMIIRTTKSRASILGQVLERHTKTLLKDVEVRLMKEGMPIHTTTSSDSHGIFKFSDVACGQLNVLVVIPQYSSRILGAFSI